MFTSSWETDSVVRKKKNVYCLMRKFCAIEFVHPVICVMFVCKFMGIPSLARRGIERFVVCYYYYFFVGRGEWMIDFDFEVLNFLCFQCSYSDVSLFLRLNICQFRYL